MKHNLPLLETLEAQWKIGGFFAALQGAVEFRTIGGAVEKFLVPLWGVQLYECHANLAFKVLISQ